MAKFQAITLRKEDNIAVITLNRPESLNAITSQMVEELHTALDNIEKDEEVRVLILTGALRAFCAGADLKPGVLVDRIVAASAEQQRREIFYGYAGVSRRLHSIEIPTVAMINGIALGAGMDWACACDFRVGSEKARFRVGFTQVATVAAAGGVWFLPRITGLPRALELTYSNRFV